MYKDYKCMIYNINALFFSSLAKSILAHFTVINMHTQPVRAAR